jgi:20S proteasome subunit beta 4
MHSKTSIHIKTGLLAFWELTLPLCRYYCLSILDKHHHPDINLEQGMKILRMCTDELKRRLPIDFKGMLVKVVTKEGVQEMDYNDDAVVKSA